MILNIGLVSPRKRQVELLALARRLHDRGIRCEWKFIGELNEDGAYARRFRDDLTHAEAAGYARHVGQLAPDQLVAAMDEAHALVHFPNEEAFGLVVAEGLARGLKLFGAKLGGIVDISRGLDGVELIDGDDLAGLERAISAWTENAPSRHFAAAAVIESRYHPLQVARRHLEIYREVLGSG